MKHISFVRKHFLDTLLTLHWRLTLWTAGLFLVLGVGLVAFINGMMSIQIPQVLRVELVPTMQPLSDPFLTSPPAIETPPSVGQTPVPLVTVIQERVIREVRLISLMGIGVFAVIGALGAYWIARKSLHPVRNLSDLVRRIQAQTLHQRLPANGPPDELRELADAFNGMLERLERAFVQQSRFVADAAHELRTPLSSMRANLEVVQQDPHATLLDYKEMSDVLERTLSRLEKLVEDLLLLAKGEKEIQTEPVEIEVLLREIIHGMQPLAQAHHIAINLDLSDSVTVLADPLLLGRAVSNLIENGVRYNHPGGSVTIRVHCTVSEVEIGVEDTGIGIPVDAQLYIFERFYRVDRSRARNRGGAGLGLAITAHIVQLHGGAIRVQSTPGRGSVFTICLPRTREQIAENHFP